MQEIPIDKAIDRFDDYLSYNSRGIFSAAFGDGKTYFLNKFKKAKADKYVFITLYPVNYQVADNYDIFDLMKRDILLQMVMNGMISEQFEMSEANYLYLYLLNENRNVLSDIFGALPYLNIIPEQAMALAPLVKLFSSWKTKYDEYKQKLKDSSAEGMIMQFLQTFDKGKGKIYEFDPITAAIVNAIKSYKEAHPDKKVVFIIEDMDRLDPMHVFRILNVLSAQIDRPFMTSLKEIEVGEYRENKFGFDNVIIVCDYHKVKKIYSHFYGLDTDFEGYIHKFSVYEPFFYSFEKELRDYLIYETKIATGINEGMIEAILRESYSGKLTIRTIHNVFTDLPSSYKDTSIVIDEQHGVTVPSSTGIVNLLVILKRLGVSEQNIISMGNKYFNSTEGLRTLDAFICWTVENTQHEIYLKKDNDHYIIYNINFTSKTNQPINILGGRVHQAQAPYSGMIVSVGKAFARILEHIK